MGHIAACALHGDGGVLCLCLRSVVSQEAMPLHLSWQRLFCLLCRLNVLPRGRLHHLHHPRNHHGPCVPAAAPTTDSVTSGSSWT